MAVKLPDGKIARTQPEQVKKNMDDIESMKSELVIIKEGIASAYKIQGSEDVADLNALEKAEDMNGYVYNMLDAGNLVNEDASTLSVQIGDNVVFVWNGGDWYWDRLAGLVDTSNLCTLDTEQTITKTKTFDEGLKITCGVNTYELKHNTYNGLAIFRQGYSIVAFGGSDFSSYSHIPSSNNTYDLGKTNFYWRDLYLSGNIYGSNSGNTDVYKNNSLVFRFQPNGFASCNYLIPVNNNGGDLGIGSNKWRDIYIAGSLKDGTNSISVAQLHKIIKHQISANGKTVQVFSYYAGSYSGETIASIFGNVAGSTAWGMKATSEFNNPNLIVVSDGGLAYFTGTGTFTKYLDPTDTITADSYSVWE